jgi:26S proteasome regulatory subunit N5
VVEAFETELRKSAGATAVFAENSEEGRKRWDDLKNRVVEHNIRIMAKYYNRITLAR